MENRSFLTVESIAFARNLTTDITDVFDMRRFVSRCTLEMPKLGYSPYKINQPQS